MAFILSRNQCVNFQPMKMAGQGSPDSKVHGANMGLTCVLLAPDGPHVSPRNLAIRVYFRVITIQSDYPVSDGRGDGQDAPKDAPKMKALKSDYEGHARLVDVPIPEPIKGEVLIKVLRAGVCATDFEILKVSIWLWGKASL